MIVNADFNHLDKIMEIIKETVEEMKSYNNIQWDESYPTLEDFEEDVKAGDLYVDIEFGCIKGFICINTTEAEEYSALKWISNEEALVIHRMAVNRKCRNTGVATKLMTFAEDLAFERNFRYIKTDTYCENEKMKALFKKFDYNFVGEVYFGDKEKPFYCYEKFLEEN